MNDFSQDEMEQLRAMFRHQSLELLEEMNHELLSLESAGLCEETIRSIRRSAHTIKGDASCLDLVGVTEITHQIEDLIDEITNGVKNFRAEQTDLILEALDAIRAAISTEAVDDVPPAEVRRLVQLLAQAGTEFDAERESTDELLPAAENSSADSSPALKETPKAPVRKQDYVRVQAGTIDALMNLAGEMVVARSVLNQCGSELESLLMRCDAMTRFQAINGRLGGLVADLQKTVLEMRMVPISQVFKRLARPMRELAAECGRKLELEFHGDDTELDRTLVDLLYEPLLHLLRNAVDHGIETPDERAAAGKNPTGKIQLTAYHEGNQIIVEISDDGRGIDPAALKAKALAAGEISATQAAMMSDEDALELLFRSGVSTAKEITWISGRGVGAAAVKAAIEQLRGQALVSSKPGYGSTFTLRMPLTLAIIRALLFKAGGRLYALPLLSVNEIIQASGRDIVMIDGLESYQMREQWLSLIRPAEVLRHERRKGGKGAKLRAQDIRFYIIVTRLADKRYGLVVEEVLGEQELVIKPLDNEWMKNEALTGASILGDGSVALILDAGILVSKAIRHERSKNAGIGAYAG